MWTVMDSAVNSNATVKVQEEEGAKIVLMSFNVQCLYRNVRSKLHSEMSSELVYEVNFLYLGYFKTCYKI